MSKKVTKKLLPHLVESIFIGLGAFIALSFIGLLARETDTLMVIAPFGATAVLLFTAPKSIFSKPKNIFGGYIITTVIGIIVLNYSNAEWFIIGSALGISIMLMHFANIVHPPAGAHLLIVSHGNVDMHLYEPLLLGLVTLIFFSIMIDKIKNRFIESSS